ncbi:MAG: YbaN family protein [Desulfuromonadales bacterium]
MSDRRTKIIDSRVLRLLLTAAGLVSTALAVLGIFLPLLPTVPLLLLAAACFARGSERFHHWLLDHPHLGPMIRGYLDDQGIPLRAKITAITLIWISIPVSVFFLIPLFWVKVFLIAIGLCVTVYLLRLPVCEGGEE